MNDFFSILAHYVQMCWDLIESVPFFDTGFRFSDYFFGMFIFFMSVGLIMVIFGGNNSNGGKFH